MNALKKFLIVTIFIVAIANEAFAADFSIVGPINGNNCDKCRIKIFDLTETGGRIINTLDSAEGGNFSDNHTRNLAHGLATSNCVSRNRPLKEFINGPYDKSYITFLFECGEDENKHSGGGYDANAGGYDPNAAIYEAKKAEKTSLSKLKATCAELGYKTKTDKFANCVLELMK